MAGLMLEKQQHTSKTILTCLEILQNKILTCLAILKNKILSIHLFIAYIIIHLFITFTYSFIYLLHSPIYSSIHYIYYIAMKHEAGAHIMKNAICLTYIALLSFIYSIKSRFLVNLGMAAGVERWLRRRRPA
jgi:hypothetical protein